jgi:hypothetical protein
LTALLASGRFDKRYGDLAPVIGASQGRFNVFYGSLDSVDWKHVGRIADFEQVTVNRLEGCDHRVVRHLRDSGWLRSFLLGMSEEKPAAG